MTIIADLHLHTIFSDGRKTPEEIVDMAIAKKLKAIAISDHDTLLGYDRAKTHAQGRLDVIPAVEMSTQYGNEDLHILGYFWRYPHQSFLEQLELFAKVRDSRALLIAQKLSEAGISITEAEIREVAKNAVIGRPHLAQILVKKNIVSCLNEAFERYLGEHTPFYVPKYKMTPKEAFVLITQAGGIPVWAHPGTVGKDDLLDELILQGLMGIEVYHTKHNRGQSQRFLTICQQRNLVVTGGSDFHAEESGAHVGDVGIQEDVYKSLKEILSTR